MTDPTTLTIITSPALCGHTAVPGDKSISHRAAMFAALAHGESIIRGWLPAGDTLATLGAIRALGVPVEIPEPTTLLIQGGTLHPPREPLYLDNAGTGLRLLAGILAGQPFASTLDGSAQLRRRPMRRLTEPLRLMGARVTDTDGLPPLHFEPASLHGIDYVMPIASGQVKSALLLAGLFASGPTTITQPGPARDHTERLLAAMGADLRQEGNQITLQPGNPLHPLDLTVPGDFSSAAFLLVAATIVPGSRVTVENVDLNPTRTGLLDVLSAMGARITVNETGTAGGDPVGTLTVEAASLIGCEVSGDIVVRMIDEFPILMIAALCAEGETIVRDARELRVKETDRIAMMANELRRLGGTITEREDGFVIRGPQTLRGAVVEGHDDHRIAMSLAVAGLVAAGTTIVHDAACAADSFPGFASTLARLGAPIQ